MSKKTKLGFNPTSIRNLTDTELDTAAGGAVTRTYKCPSIWEECPDPTMVNSCEGSCAASCGATCGASCAATCGASCTPTCNASCNASCGGTCNIRCQATNNAKCPSWLC